MRWFKCLDPNHPLMAHIVYHFGMEGYGYACAMLAQAETQQVFEIDTVTLKHWLNPISYLKASKFLPHFKKILDEAKKAEGLE